MTIKPLNIPLKPVNPIKKQPTLIDRCASIAKSLFALIALLASATFIVKKIIALAFLYPLTFVSTIFFLSLTCLRAITTVLATYILKSSAPPSQETSIIKDASSKYKSDIQTIQNFSSIIDSLKIFQEKLNKDTRYSNYIIVNGESLKNSQKGWVNQLTDLLKEEGFPEQKILNVLKSVEIQIFCYVLEEITSFIESKNHFPVAMLDDNLNKIMEIQTQVTFSKESNNCLIELKKGMSLYKAISEMETDHPEYKTADVEAPLGAIFLKMTISIAKDPDQTDQLSYVWNMNDPTDERLRFLSERQDLLKD